MSDQQITEETRQKVIQGVKSGNIPFAPTLMKRLGITPEECMSPKAIFPNYKYYKYTTPIDPPTTKPDLNKLIIDDGAKIGSIVLDPVLEFVDKFVLMAVEQGLDKDFVINECTINPKFMELYRRAMEDMINGSNPEIKIEDFQFLYEALARTEGESHDQ